MRPRTECGARSLSANSTLGWLKFGRAARTAAAHIAPRLRPGRGLGCRAGGLGCCRAHHWPRPSAPCAELPCSRPAPRGADLDPATCIVLSGFDFVAPVQPASVWDSVTANSAPHASCSNICCQRAVAPTQTIVRVLRPHIRGAWSTVCMHVRTASVQPNSIRNSHIWLSFGHFTFFKKKETENIT